MQRLTAALLMAVGMLVGGCQPTSVNPNAPATVARIDALELRAMPSAINWDDEPGPDGLRAEVFCYRIDQPEPFPVEGQLEFLLYEGRLRGGELASADPLLTWRFGPSELRGLMIRRLGLWGYSMQLAWGDRMPRTSSVTLIARHRSPEGRTVHSSPISISMGAR
ncbi:MAG: hypothetical protein ACP5HU_03615 [Phycisphaerae bacterium]